MARSVVPVDLFNPGQVFACIGLAELGEILIGNARGCFDWSDQQGRFVVETAGDSDPLGVALDYLANAEVSVLAPDDGPDLSTGKWRLAARVAAEGSPFPIPRPDAPAMLPAVLEGPSASGKRTAVFVDHWGDGTERDAVKLWAGAGGMPGGALLRDGLALVRPLPELAKSDPFNVRAPQSSSFRFDWRRDNIPVSLGFNLNDHAEIESTGYPLVEVFAAIGLTHARPRRLDKLRYAYCVTGSPKTTHLLDLPLLRAGLGARLPFPQRHFLMHLDWPGQEGQARSITHVTEERVA